MYRVREKCSRLDKTNGRILEVKKMSDWLKVSYTLGTVGGTATMTLN